MTIAEVKLLKKLLVLQGELGAIEKEMENDFGGFDALQDAADVQKKMLPILRALGVPSFTALNMTDWKAELKTMKAELNGDEGPR